MQQNMYSGGGMNTGNGNWPSSSGNNSNKGRKSNYGKQHRNNQNQQQQQMMNQSMQQDSRSGHGSHNHGGAHGGSDVGSNHHVHEGQPNKRGNRQNSGNNRGGGNYGNQHMGARQSYGGGYTQYGPPQQQTAMQGGLNQSMMSNQDRQDRNVNDRSERQYNQGYNNQGYYQQRQGGRHAANNNTNNNNVPEASSASGPGNNLNYSSKADQDQIWKHDMYDKMQKEPTGPHYYNDHGGYYANASFNEGAHENQWQNKQGGGNQYKYGKGKYPRNNQGNYYEHPRGYNDYDKGEGQGGREIRYSNRGNQDRGSYENNRNQNQQQFHNNRTKKGNNQNPAAMNVKSSAFNYSVSDQYYGDQQHYGQYERTDSRQHYDNQQQRKMSNSGSHQNYNFDHDRDQNTIQPPETIRESRRDSLNDIRQNLLANENEDQMSQNQYERKSSFQQQQQEPSQFKQQFEDISQQQQQTTDYQIGTEASMMIEQQNPQTQVSQQQPTNNMGALPNNLLQQNFNNLPQLSPLQGLQVQGVQSNIAHMMPQNGLVTLLQISIKLQNRETITIYITEDPSHGVQPLNFYDIQSQITFQLSQYKKQMTDPEKLQNQINNAIGEDKRTSGGDVQSLMESPAQEKRDLMGTPSKKSAKKSNHENSGQKMQKSQQALVDNQDLIEAFEFYVKRQLQIYNMNKYQQIAHNTQKIQHLQNLQNIQNLHSLQSLQQQMQQIQQYQLIQQQNNQSAEGQMNTFQTAETQKSNPIEKILLAEQLNFQVPPPNNNAGINQVFNQNGPANFGESGQMQFSQASMQSQPFYPNGAMIGNAGDATLVGVPQQPNTETKMPEQAQPPAQNIIQYNAQNVNFIQFSTPQTPTTMTQPNSAGTPKSIKSEEKGLAMDNKPYDQTNFLQQMLIKQQQQQQESK